MRNRKSRPENRTRQFFAVLVLIIVSVASMPANQTDQAGSGAPGLLRARASNMDARAFIRG